MKTVFYFSLLTCLMMISCRKSRTQNNGCLSPATELEFTGGYLFIPNVFTPNGDGNYDVLVPQSQGVAIMSLMITTTAGKQVFFTNDVNNYWNGEDERGKLKSGVYKYQFTGTTISGESIAASSEVTVVVGSDVSCINNTTGCIYDTYWTDSTGFQNFSLQDTPDLSCN